MTFKTLHTYIVQILQFNCTILKKKLKSQQLHYDNKEFGCYLYLFYTNFTLI